MPMRDNLRPDGEPTIAARDVAEHPMTPMATPPSVARKERRSRSVMSIRGSEFDEALNLANAVAGRNPGAHDTDSGSHASHRRLSSVLDRKSSATLRRDTRWQEWS